MGDELEARLSAGMVATQGGDAAACRELLRACVPVIASIVRASLPDAAVDDAVQDALLTVHRVRHTYDPARPFLPWLRAIARRRAIDALRRQGRRRETHAPERYESFPDPGDAADTLLEARDQRRRLVAAVSALPAAQREAVQRLAFDGHSLDDAARASGRSKGALKVNLHRAIKTLRAAFEAGGRDGD